MITCSISSLPRGACGPWSSTPPASPRPPCPASRCCLMEDQAPRPAQPSSSPCPQPRAWPQPEMAELQENTSNPEITSSGNEIQPPYRLSLKQDTTLKHIEPNSIFPIQTNYILDANLLCQKVLQLSSHNSIPKDERLEST